MTVRRERNAEKSRQDILRAAERHFAEKGFYGARVDEIAAEAVINKRMIYEYFDSKEGLYKQVLFEVYKRLETAERELIEHQLSGVALIRSLISMYFDFLRDNDTFVSILMWENLNHARYLNEMPGGDVERPTIRFFMNEIPPGQGSRHLPPGAGRGAGGHLPDHRLLRQLFQPPHPFQAVRHAPGQPGNDGKTQTSHH